HRDRWQRPSEVTAALNLRDGNVVADVGSGSGYFSLKLSHAVGPAGQVLAIDTRPEPLASCGVEHSSEVRTISAYTSETRIIHTWPWKRSTPSSSRIPITNSQIRA